MNLPQVQEEGASREITELTGNFNQMSQQIASSVDQLRAAARENRELFLGSVRALLRAVEAKEPYTRGHSERVAAYSQAIARRLGASIGTCPGTSVSVTWFDTRHTRAY